MNILKIPNQRIVGNLSPINKSKIDGIALHHMAHPTWTVKDVENCHVNTNGWSAIGYNWWIGFDGGIYEGRGFNQGAGVANHNSHLISIGFQGDYQSNKLMPQEQFNAGVNLIVWLIKQLPNVAKVSGHNCWNATACPGDNFPLTEMIKKSLEIVYNQNGSEKLEEVEQPEENMEHLVRKYQYCDDNIPLGLKDEISMAIMKGIISYSDNGFSPPLSESEIRTLAWIVRAMK